MSLYRSKKPGASRAQRVKKTTDQLPNTRKSLAHNMDGIDTAFYGLLLTAIEFGHVRALNGHNLTSTLREAEQTWHPRKKRK